MAPQRTSDKTHYGALDFVEESGQSETRSFTLKYLVGLALVAVAVTAAVFAFTSPVSDAAPNSVEDYNNREIAHILEGGFEGDDRAHGTDCECQDTCDSDDGLTGTCTVTQTDCVDAISRLPKIIDGVLKATCIVTSGGYDCWSYPCINQGYCVDQVNGYKCICPFGYEGDTCQYDVDECGTPEAGTVNVCAAHSTCENSVGAYGCTCNDGFYGDGYAVDQAIVSYGSILSASTDASLVKTYGWLERSAASTPGCEDVNDCASNPCHHGSQCTDLWATQALSNAFSCDCSSVLPNKRYDGEFCEYDVDECTSGLHNCVAADRATCLNTEGSFECACNDGWRGDGMYDGPNEAAEDFGFAADYAFEGCTDIDDCKIMVEQDDGSFAQADGPCMNGGTCSNELPGNGEFVCACTEGWEGTFCTIDINECDRKGDTACTIADSHCSNTPGDWECLCDDGYTGDPNAWCFDADDCEFSPCKNGGTCTDCGTNCLMCDCVGGYRGPKCNEDWDECALGIHTCHANGHCKNTYGSFTCECLPGYSGDGYVAGKSEKVDTCIMWEDKVKTCGEYGAECTQNSDCASGVDCVVIDDEVLVDYVTRVYDSNGFLDRANSLGEISGATWMDDKQVTDANGVVVTQCGIYDASTNAFTSHGQCADVGQSYVCTCDDGWQDSNCDRDIDECAAGTHECARYATCSNTDGSYTCACNSGHRGDGTTSCHDIDDCTTGTGARCTNGKCTDTGKNNWSCQCMDGWQDSNCDRDINECLLVATECPANAECVNSEGSYECTCKEGFTGTGDSACDPIDDCASSPCAHGACVDHGTTGYGCVCEDGWTDFNCDFDVNECVLKTHNCHSSPRADLEPSRCVNNPGSYYCRCISGFEGDGWTCTDIDDCDPDPCCKDNNQVVPGFTQDALGLTVAHGGCIDSGANKYHCNCAEGWSGANCCDPVTECPDCTNNAQCDDRVPIYGESPPGYTCDCNTGYYGDGHTNCNPCSDCAEIEPKGAWKLDPNGAACGVGPNGGADTVCIPANECEMRTHNCDTTCSTCYDLHPDAGGFRCEAQGEYFSNDGACSGTEGTCQAFDTCGKGMYMALEGDSCNDRVCKRVIPDGKYAIETGAGGVSQCLVLWAESAKVFPERYNWGGRTVEEGKSATDYADSADACPNPVCGVCDYNNRGASANIELGQVAAWTFARLNNDNYLILSNVDGNGFRCLGFDKTGDGEIVSPYPQLISFEAKMVESSSGVCAATATQVRTETVCELPTDCAGDEFCLKEDVEGGSWSTDLTGPDSIFDADGTLNYFCGFDTNQFGSAIGKLQADPQTVWNVHQLGCDKDSEMTMPRWYCEDSKYDMKFVIRSMADFKKIGQPEAPNNSYSAHCLYFPDSNGGQYTNPRRVPETPTADGVWMGGMYNSDTNDDHDCGIATAEGQSQEEALLNNGAAVFHLIAL